MANIQIGIVAGLLFVAFFGSMMGIFLEQSSTYGVPLNSVYFDQDTINNSGINQFQNLSVDITEEFESSDNTDKSNVDASIVGGFNALKKSLVIAPIVRGVLDDIFISLKIPKIIITVVITIIVLTVALA